MIAARRAALVAVVFVLALTLAGCGDRYDGRIEVNGEVKFKGKPLTHGTIAFVPLDGQSTSANPGINEDGTYSIPREGGLKPGKYLIRITAGDGQTPYLADAEHPPGPTGSPTGRGNTNIISKELIPKDWNEKSKQERTVGGESPNKFDFDIP